MIKAIIVDDEQPARDIIKAYLKNHPDVEVAGECSNGFEGIKMINELNPDLVFLDIQMPKITGFEMLELLEKPPSIIFSTAYDEYALKAFEMNAVDYLLKPFSAQRFDEAIKKIKSKISLAGNEGEQYKNLQNYIERLDRIAVRNGSNIFIIPLENISFIEAQDDYVAIHADGKKYLKQYTMKWLDQSLPPENFLRVHRSYILRIDKISKLEAMTKDSYIAVLKDGSQLPVSRNGYNSLKKILGI